jgi:hypothetical protein
MNIENILERLSYSKFRSSFHLGKKDILYINEKGLETIKEHTHDFISSRLAPYPTKNDGKQTPMRGHPTFIAQHATATCCRGCLYKWYGIDKNRELTKEEQEFIVNVIVKWLEKELKN